MKELVFANYKMIINLPKKPKDIKQDVDYKIGQCPICDCTLMYGNNYCPSCGQNIDWGEEDENY